MGDILLSPKEARRCHVLEMLAQGQLTAEVAAGLLDVTTRQVFRLKARFAVHGVAGLAHRNRGKPPKHAIPEEARGKVVAGATGLYRGASCAHMAELLLEHDKIQVSAKSIARILRTAGLPVAHTHRAPRKRRRRQRLSQEGLLVQMDASPHAWLEQRGPKMSLHGIIDDATSKVLALHFRPNEDARGYLLALEKMIRRHGVPRHAYTDLHTMFVSPTRLTIEEELDGKTQVFTQLGAVLHALGIGHVKARSPQAKGRVERLWGTLQSRLTIEMRLANVCSIDDANAFLPSFVDRFNERFSVAAADPTIAFAASPPAAQLKRLLVLRESRKSCKASTISWDGKTYRLRDRYGRVAALPPKCDVVLNTPGAGSVFATVGNQSYTLEEFQPPPSIAPSKRTPVRVAGDTTARPLQKGQLRNPTRLALTSNEIHTPSDTTDRELLEDLARL